MTRAQRIEEALTGLVDAIDKCEHIGSQSAYATAARHALAAQEDGGDVMERAAQCMHDSRAATINAKDAMRLARALSRAGLLARPVNRERIALRFLLGETAPISGDLKHWACQVCSHEWESEDGAHPDTIPVCAWAQADRVVREIGGGR